MKITHDSIGSPLMAGDLIWAAKGFYSKGGFYLIRELTDKSIRTIFLCRNSADLDAQPAVKHITYTQTLFKIDVAAILQGHDTLLRRLLIAESNKLLNGNYKGVKETRAPRVPGVVRLNINNLPLAQPAHYWPAIAAQIATTQVVPPQPPILVDYNPGDTVLQHFVTTDHG